MKTLYAEMHVEIGEQEVTLYLKGKVVDEGIGSYEFGGTKGHQEKLVYELLSIGSSKMTEEITEYILDHNVEIEIYFSENAEECE